MPAFQYRSYLLPAKTKKCTTLLYGYKEHEEYPYIIQHIASQQIVDTFSLVTSLSVIPKK